MPSFLLRKPLIMIDLFEIDFALGSLDANRIFAVLHWLHSKRGHAERDMRNSMSGRDSIQILESK